MNTKNDFDSKDKMAITQEKIYEALKSAAIQPSQKRVSLPKIKRNIALLEKSSIAPCIKVVDGIIVEGHHRYVAGLLFGLLPDIAPSVRTSALMEYNWAEIEIDEKDWG